VRLRAWAVVSVLAGLALIAVGDPFWRGFGIQAVAWGLINGVIAWAGYRNAQKRARPPEAEARHLLRLLWVNAGLDLLYIAIGAAVIVFLGPASPEASGHGWGVVVQGAFLLVFDALHALRLPPEPRLPAVQFFTGPEHQPFTLHSPISDSQPSRSKTRAALLVHGFPGTPAEMRALGESLHAAGWTVRGLLLPGFGSDIPTLIYRRYADWVRAVEAELAALRREHERVIVVGYSFGGALALSAAARVPADGLVLIAPFLLTQPWWQQLMFLLIGPFLPYAFRPYARADFSDPRFRHVMDSFVGGADLDDPELHRALRDLAVPATILQEAAETTTAYRAAERVRAPALIVQGVRDEIARLTDVPRLLKAFGGRARYLRVDAGHDLLEPGKPGWAEVERAVLEFALEVSSASEPDGLEGR
jgi:esterase/lipase